MLDPRCARQRLLPEVGTDGQARLGQTPAHLPPIACAAVAARYLERAGVQVVIEQEAAPPRAFPHATHLHHAASRDVAEAAWLALEHVRSVLLQG